jgi:hypothetical protein
MAKQTFTTGQVLTAAQMTSLQQTAMSGGAATAKTASYTLVAADAGSAISMSNASATTITVNTALFAAGDTVHITNLGAGVCTITAGTATVNSSASLALAQYESGFLDFTSTSAAIFVKGAGAAAASGGMTLISTTTLSGTTTTISSIPATYKNLQVVVRNPDSNNNPVYMKLRFNSDSNTRYREIQSYGITSDLSMNDTSIDVAFNFNTTTTEGIAVIDFYDYANTTTFKIGHSLSIVNDTTDATLIDVRTFDFCYNQLSAISSLTFVANVGSFTAGTVLLYGVK